MSNAPNGLEPRTTGPERRALYDLRRRVSELEQRAGVPGPEGPPGEPGEPGGSLLSAFWQYATATTTPPAAGQMRTNFVTPITELYVNETDTDGFNRALGLATVGEGSEIYLRAANGGSQNLLITGTPVDHGTWWTFPVFVTAGSTGKGSRTQLNFVNARTTTAWTNLPFAGTWRNYGSGFQTAQYRKVGDMVQLRGLVQNTGSDTTVAQLPTGYRPNAGTLMLAHASGVGTTGSGASRFDIYPSGNMLAYLASGTAPFDYLSLAGLQFSVTP